MPIFSRKSVFFQETPMPLAGSLHFPRGYDILLPVSRTPPYADRSRPRPRTRRAGRTPRGIRPFGRRDQGSPHGTGKDMRRRDAFRYPSDALGTENVRRFVPQVPPPGGFARNRRRDARARDAARIPGVSPVRRGTVPEIGNADRYGTSRIREFPRIADKNRTTT